MIGWPWLEANTLQRLSEIGLYFFKEPLKARPSHIQTLRTSAYLNSAWSKGFGVAICLKQFCPKLKSLLDHCGLALGVAGTGCYIVSRDFGHSEVEWTSFSVSHYKRVQGYQVLLWVTFGLCFNSLYASGNQCTYNEILHIVQYTTIL